VTSALPDRAATKPIEIWFQDEARVGQKGGHAYIWAPVGSRPPMLRDNRHVNAYIFGAICPQRGVAAGIIMPYVDTHAMNEHLRCISDEVTPGAHGIVVCDGAGWHQSGKRLEVPDNITLVRLPPYSPELNPVENVWLYLRTNKLASSVWQTYEEILEACCQAWNFLAQDPQRIRSIGTRDWARVSQ
jgi:DDE superfamily endonuclease